MGPWLYVGGGVSPTQGVYWKARLVDPVPVIADSLINSDIVTSMVSSNDGLYLAAQGAGYWKNNAFIALPYAVQIDYLAVSDGTIYATGLNNYEHLTYWIGNAEVDLGNTYFDRTRWPDQGVTTYGLSGIAASGNSVYVTGYLSFANEPMTPDSVVDGNFALLWTNGNMQPFGPGVSLSAYYKSTTGVAIVGKDVYVSGEFPDTTYAGGYWKNGAWNPIANGTFLPSTITTNGTSICMPGNYWARGSYTKGAAYWLDGKLIPLPGYYAVAATFFNSDIYVLGIDNDNNYVVWKNGALFETIGSAVNLTATCLAIQ